MFSNDGQAAFAIDMLAMQLGEQHRAQQRGLSAENVALRAHNDQLIHDYNHLVDRFFSLVRESNARIADLERRLAEAGLARERAEAEAETERLMAIVRAQPNRDE
jgi:hypothetical protein